MKVLGNVAIIVLGVVIASFGEIKFEFWGFIFQIGGIVTEALRLVMVQRLLSAGDFKMDPLVSLYYYAPACAVTNAVITLFVEGPRITMGDIYAIGPFVLVANALVAFFLNVSSVLLVSKPYPLPSCSPLTSPDRSNLRRGPHHVGRPQGHSPRLCLHVHLPRSCHRPAVFRLLDRTRWTHVLQAGRRESPVLGNRCAPALWRLSPEEPRANEACGNCRHVCPGCLGILDVGPDGWRRLCQVCPGRGQGELTEEIDAKYRLICTIF